ncbi:calcium-binding EF hand family protein [Fagus crenata]
MGLVMSLMGKGLPKTQILDILVGPLYDQKKINNFDEFQIAILDIFNTFNSALPGKHFDIPSKKEVEACLKNWEEASQSNKKREVFIDFMTMKVNLNKVDNSMLITGIVTPPAAMAAKRAGENVTQLKVIKAIPDVPFVPSATVLALIFVKVSRRMFMGKIA